MPQVKSTLAKVDFIEFKPGNNIWSTHRLAYTSDTQIFYDQRSRSYIIRTAEKDRVVPACNVKYADFKRTSVGS